MTYVALGPADEARFHALASAYYREGEDADTPQEEIDAFIRQLFGMTLRREISGCLLQDGEACVGFALWAIDHAGFAFSELPGSGVILEIGLLPSHRGFGHGKALVAFVEAEIQAQGGQQCYVTAYGPAQAFWDRCGYVPDGRTASNGLPIMLRDLRTR